MTAFTVRPLTLADTGAWAAMRAALWPSEDAAILRDETAAMLARADAANFCAVSSEGRLIGFIEVGTRDIAESATTSPVGYIEGLWVEPGHRQRGAARTMVAAAVGWCRSRGYRELGSDVEIENAVSQAAHERLGFTETERLVTYLMPIAD